MDTSPSSFNFKNILSPFRRPISLERVLTVVALALGYYVAGRFGLSFASINPSVSAIWPPAGIAVAAVFLLGYDVWPGIFIGAFFVNFGASGMWLPSVFIAAGNTLEAVVGLYLVRRFVPTRKVFDRTKDAVWFIFLAGFVGTALAATIGTVAVLFEHATPLAAAGGVWFTWWMGDAAGVLIIAPLLILWGTIRGVLWKVGKIAKFVGVFLLAMLTEKAAFGTWLSFVPHGFPIEFIMLPPLIVGAFWLGRRWEMTTVFFLAVLATRDTLMGFGPAAGFSPNESLLLLQTFLGVAAVTTLIVSTLIAERHEAMESLAAREQYFRSLIEKSSDGIVLVDAAGSLIYASHSLTHLTGYVRTDILAGTPALDVIHPDDLAMVAKTLHDVAAVPEEAATFEARVRHRAGRWVWLSITATNLLSYGPVRAIVLNLRDVTAEHESRQAKSYLASIVESADDAVIGRDLEGTIHSWNKGAERLYGYTAAEAIGQPIGIIIPPGRKRDEFGEISAHIRRGESVTHYETVRVRKDGTLIPVSFSVSPMRDNAGNVIGASIIARDLSKEKAIERRKHEFISSVSYQLRGPVGEIGTYIESLTKRHGRFTPIEKQYLLKIENANLKMTILLNNLLKVTRLELDTILVEPKPVELKREIDYVAREFAEKLGARSVSFERGYRTFRPVTITLDPALLTAALTNIFSHALSCVPPRGTVSVDIMQGEREIQIHIRESGNHPTVPASLNRATRSATVPADGFAAAITAADFAGDETAAVSVPGQAAIHDPVGDSIETDPAMDIYVAKSLVERIGGILRADLSPSGGIRFSIAFPLK